jgi:hypothetical protein
MWYKYIVVVFVQTPPQLFSSPAQPNANEIQAQFVAQVAAGMREPSQSEGRNTQGPVPTAGNNVAGSESKPHNTASSANLPLLSSEEAKGEVAKELTPAPVTTTVEPRAARNLEPRTVVRCTYAEGEVQFHL